MPPVRQARTLQPVKRRLVSILHGREVKGNIMILANKNGWIIAVQVVRKTRSGTHVKPIDSKHTTFISLRDASCKLCSDADEAVAFVKS